MERQKRTVEMLSQKKRVPQNAVCEMHCIANEKRKMPIGVVLVSVSSSLNLIVCALASAVCLQTTTIEPKATIFLSVLIKIRFFFLCVNAGDAYVPCDPDQNTLKTDAVHWH